MTEAPALPLSAMAPNTGLSGVAHVPGDKSISHRALMLGALAIGQTRITGLLEGEDVRRTAQAMQALGTVVTREAAGVWTVQGRGIGGLSEPSDVLDMGNSGTAARLLCGILATHPITSVLTGDASLRRRPMARVTAPLAATGARFFARADGLLPLTVVGTGAGLPLDYPVPVASAQVKSALLLAGLNARGQTRISEAAATRDHTEHLLRHFGAAVEVAESGAGRVITLAGQPELGAADVAVPGDPSSAAFPLVAALIVPGSRVRLPRIGLNPLRIGLIETLQDMGATITIEAVQTVAGERVGDLLVEATTLRGVEVPAERAPRLIDEYPVLAVAAACARGITRLRGLAELRVKESDRLAATASLLAVNGVGIDREGDDLIVQGCGGPPPGGGLVATRSDHRTAMSALVLGQATRAPVRVDDVRFIDTSFPGFVALMAGLGARFAP